MGELVVVPEGDINWRYSAGAAASFFMPWMRLRWLIYWFNVDGQRIVGRLYGQWVCVDGSHFNVTQVWPTWVCFIHAAVDASCTATHRTDDGGHKTWVRTKNCRAFIYWFPLPFLSNVLLFFLTYIWLDQHCLSSVSCTGICCVQCTSLNTWVLDIGWWCCSGWHPFISSSCVSGTMCISTCKTGCLNMCM